ncbi:hypothetical protein SSX86_005449 [Deinandra increscens subsp. villosa]|uniref:WAT1-related protein n=1 Tax=Deinandra increscens subsp. villosa TaxID=3103831 RepID=A0AAP0H6V9_9ASTR
MQSLVCAVPTERSWSRWKLDSNFRLFSAIFQGICSLLAFFLIMAAVHLQGPLFVSVFNPLVLVFVAIAGFLVLDEKLYMGSLLGSIIIIAGLYLVLWGKGKETKRLSKQTHSVTVEEGDKLPVKSPKEEHKEKEII